MFIGYVVMLFHKQWSLIDNGVCDGLVKLSNIEFNKGTVLFIFDVPKPFYKTSVIFPLVEVQQFI